MEERGGGGEAKGVIHDPVRFPGRNRHEIPSYRNLPGHLYAAPVVGKLSCCLWLLITGVRSRR